MTDEIAAPGSTSTSTSRRCTLACSPIRRVALAPHLGSATWETRTAMAELAAHNVLAVLRGEEPLTPVGAAP